MKTGLEEYIETGIPLDADISGHYLLILLFLIRPCMMEQ